MMVHCGFLDCTKPIKARKLCDAHLQRWYRHGDFEDHTRRGYQCSWWTGDDASYNAGHLRVRAARGPASGPCSHCYSDEVNTQFQWAQIHDTSGAFPEHFMSLCKRCHEEYDAKGPTTEQVQEIKALAYFGVRQARLAKMYLVHPSFISYILSGKKRNAPVFSCMGA